MEDLGRNVTTPIPDRIKNISAVAAVERVTMTHRTMYFITVNGEIVEMVCDVLENAKSVKEKLCSKYPVRGVGDIRLFKENGREWIHETLQDVDGMILHVVLRNFPHDVMPPLTPFMTNNNHDVIMGTLNGRLYVIGIARNVTTKEVSSACYDPVRNEWYAIANVKNIYRLGGKCVEFEGKMYLYGSIFTSDATKEICIEMYDDLEDKWSVLDPPFDKSSSLNISHYQNDCIYISLKARRETGGKGLKMMYPIHKYDLKEKVWSEAHKVSVEEMSKICKARVSVTVGNQLFCFLRPSYHFCRFTMESTVPEDWNPDYVLYGRFEQLFVFNHHEIELDLNNLADYAFCGIDETSEIAVVNCGQTNSCVLFIYNIEKNVWRQSSPILTTTKIYVKIACIGDIIYLLYQEESETYVKRYDLSRDIWLSDSSCGEM